jgi:hypothetical protein
MPTYRSRPPEDHELLCELTGAELRLKGDQLAEAENAYELAEADKKAAMAVFAQRLEAARNVTRKLSQEILSKQERRQVPCNWRVEPSFGEDMQPRWVLRRDDNDKVVTTQPVTQADRQVELSLS